MIAACCGRHVFRKRTPNSAIAAISVACQLVESAISSNVSPIFTAFRSSCFDYRARVQMKLVPGDLISDSIAFLGLYDLSLTRLLCRLAREGGHLVDVGANLGYFSLLWAEANACNTVTAFEASPRNQELLRHNVGQNGFSARIQVRAEAVGRGNGEMEFDLGPEDQTGWGGLVLVQD